MAGKSLAAQTPGALQETNLQLPEVFTKPPDDLKSRFTAPYVTFAHPKRADEYSKLVATFGTVLEGGMYLMKPDGPVALDPMKASLLCCRQFWAQVAPNGDVQAASFTENPNWKEHIEAVLLVYLEDRIVPANITFRSTKCPAGHTLNNALKDAATAAWLEKSPQHKETGVCQQPFMRFYGSVSLGVQRTSKRSGLPYKPTQCAIKPTGVAEWRLLKQLIDDPNTKKLLEDAAARYTYRLEDIAKKVAA